MFVYIYVHTYIFVYIHVHIYIYIFYDRGYISNSSRGHICVFGYVHVFTRMFHTCNIYIRTCLYIHTYMSVYIYFMIEGTLATAPEEKSASSDTCVCLQIRFIRVTFTYVHVCTYMFMAEGTLATAQEETWSSLDMCVYLDQIRSSLCENWMCVTEGTLATPLEETPASVHTCVCGWECGVATISRLLKIIGLLCKRAI